MRKELMIGAAFALLCFLVYWGNPSLDPGPGDRKSTRADRTALNMTSLLERVVPLGIVALGVGLVIVAGGIDLSVGSVISLSSVVLAKAHLPEEEFGLGWGLWPSIGLALGVSAVVGLGQGLLIARLRLQPFIVTLAGMLFLRGLADVLSGGSNLTPGTDAWGVSFRSWPEQGVRLPWPGATEGPLASWLTFVLLGIAAALAYLLHGTVFGRHLFAIGGNREAARYSGVPVGRVETLVYVLSSLLAGAAGVCLAAGTGSGGPMLGATYELYAIAAAVLGGCALIGGEGSILGILIGVALFKVLENGFTLNQRAIETWTRSDRVPGWLRPIFTKTFAVDTLKNAIYGAVILAAVLLDRATAAWRDFLRRRKVR